MNVHVKIIGSRLGIKNQLSEIYVRMYAPHPHPLKLQKKKSHFPRDSVLDHHDDSFLSQFWLSLLRLSFPKH